MADNILSGIDDDVTLRAVGKLQDMLGFSGSVDLTRIAFNICKIAGLVNPKGLAPNALKEIRKLIAHEIETEL